MLIRSLAASSLLTMALLAASCGTPAVAPTAPAAPQEGAAPPEGTTPGSAGAAEPGAPPPESAAQGAEQAQPSPSAPGPAPTGGAEMAPDRNVVGGYAAQDVASPKVQKAAARAVELLRKRANDPSLSLSRVISAETQIVAGQNYRMELELTSHGGTKRVKVVLFRDLQDHEQLTSVEGL